MTQQQNSTKSLPFTTPVGIVKLISIACPAINVLILMSTLLLSSAGMHITDFVFNSGFLRFLLTSAGLQQNQQILPTTTGHPAVFAMAVALVSGC